MDKPQYKKQPILDIDSLAECLSIDKKQLIYIANRSNSFYHLHSKKKKSNGSFREIYGVKKDLKFIQKQIIEKIYYNVYFPHYLYGSVKDSDSPRSHIKAAEAHLNAKLLINVDISNFFPSLKSDVIFAIWKEFFNFHNSVAEILTKLTTFKGFLPQGAPTSSGLANLAFWDIEPTVVHKLKENSFTYTRYVDDVAISSENYIGRNELNPIFSDIFDMFRRKGVYPNKEKTKISTSKDTMLVHKLNINNGVLTLPKSFRNNIKTAIRQCEIEYHEGKQSEDYKDLWNSTLGRVEYLSQLHPNQGKKLRKRLETIKPLEI